jgi:group I intron endonuclease
MKKTCGIYKITSPSERVYIGQSRNIEHRFRRYKRLHKSNNTQVKLTRSFTKYGVDNHTLEIIEECEFNQLNIRERFWQDYYNVLKGGLNCILTETDVLPRVISEESKLKRSGKNHWTYGRTFTEESKKKMSESAKGREFSKETRKKLSEVREGDKNHFYGKKHSKKSKLKQRKRALQRKTQPASKEVNQYTLDGEYIKTWKSVTEASKKIGVAISGISYCISDKQKTSGKFKWKFK